ncbi:MAG: DUF1577 domain-containing protein [Spirochaetes bacterium]|nr:DUF1577 domain-containing protein [Spirochaetota bacterium]
MTSFIELKNFERKFEEIDSVKNIIQILDDNLSRLTLYIKFDIERNIVQISEITDDNGIVIITNPAYTPVNNKLTIYSLLDKYFEIDLQVAEVRGPGFFKCDIIKAKRAISVRKELRLKVKAEQVIASNFMVSKHSIDVSNYKIPTSIKVLLDQFHSQNTNLSDVFKVGFFEQSSGMLERIKKSGKIFFLRDLSNPESFNYSDDDIIDANEIMGKNINEYIKKYIEKGYKSIIIAPINYVTDSGNVFSFAYAQMISKSGLFTFDDISKLKQTLNSLVTRIKDSNTIIINTNQQITDLSKSGAKLYITDENLKKYLVNTKGFVFNIVFKLQAPITVYSEIKNIYRDSEDNLFVGVIFAGHSSRKGEMKRYYSFLDPMIKSYKEKLLAQRKKSVKPVEK